MNLTSEPHFAPRAFLLALLLIPVIPLQAQSLLECAAIDDPGVRLSCYDKLAGRTEGPEPVPAPTIAPQVTVPAAPAAAPESVVVDSAVAATASSAPVPTQGVSSYDDLFGLENQAANRGLEEIQSRITDDFKGWNGKTVFNLENGQVWQQSDVNAKLSWRGELHPIATIKRKTFGSYMLGVEGTNRMVRVRRIK